MERDRIMPALYGLCAALWLCKGDWFSVIAGLIWLAGAIIWGLRVWKEK